MITILEELACFIWTNVKGEKLLLISINVICYMSRGWLGLVGFSMDNIQKHTNTHMYVCARMMNECRGIFQHFGNFAPDFGISQLLIVPFSNGLQHSGSHAICFPVVCDPEISIKYLVAMDIAREYRNDPSWEAAWPHCCDCLGDTCDGLRWSAMLLKG